MPDVEHLQRHGGRVRIEHIAPGAAGLATRWEELSLAL
jgi:hypothetical protein